MAASPRRRRRLSNRSPSTWTKSFPPSIWRARPRADPRAIRAIHSPASPGVARPGPAAIDLPGVVRPAIGAGRKRQQQHRPATAPPLEATAKIDARIRRLFPFELTAGQQQAIAEIAADMARPQPMNRLLQGDVGSGKTVVAVYAMLLAIAHG